MSDKQMHDTDLEPYFGAVRTQEASPSGDLMERVLADALAAQAEMQRAGAEMAKTNPPVMRVWAQVWGAIGGWPAVAGLATATVAGVWVGVNPPEGVGDVMASMLGSDTETYLIDVMPGLGFEAGEGDAG